MTQRTFGRRVSFEPRPPRRSEEPCATAPLGGVAPARPSIDGASLTFGEIKSSHDEELREWREARSRTYRFPWRQVLLMASLCFGVATFVLPDKVSDDLDWLLYGLMAASFIVGIRRRRSGA